MPNLDELQSWHRRDLIDRDGDKIGSIGDVYLDEQTGQPEWLTVKTGLFGTRESFVPIAEARAEGDTVRVPYEKSHVKDAPNVDADGALSHDEESQLYRHYGRGRHAAPAREDRADRGTAARPRHRRPGRLGPGDRRRDDALGGGGPRRHHPPRDRPRAAAQVRRHRERDADRPRPARGGPRRARADHRRQPRRRALRPGDITEEEHEVTLHAEEPVVEKRTVPKERVRMDRDTVTDEQTVSEQVRKERIEAEGDVDQRFRTEDDIARDRR